VKQPFAKIAMFDFSAKGWNRWAKIHCGMCVLFMLVGAVFAVYRWSYVRRAITTSATITSLIERKNDDGDTLYAPVYVFTDQRGQSVKVISSTASFPPPGEIGDKIEILYDPANPKHSIQRTFFDIWGFPAISGGLGAFYFIVFAAVAFFTGRHLKRKGAPDGAANGSQPFSPGTNTTSSAAGSRR
jgi:hypothetical protein